MWLIVSAFCWAFGFSTVAVSIHNRHHKTGFLYDCFFSRLPQSHGGGEVQKKSPDTEALKKSSLRPCKGVLIHTGRIALTVFILFNQELHKKWRNRA